MKIYNFGNLQWLNLFEKWEVRFPDVWWIMANSCLLPICLTYDTSLQNSNDRSIIECLVAKKSPIKYDESVRRFCLTMHSLGPRAYQFFRQRFHNNFPHPSTLRKYYANSSSNGEPGISKDSLESLRKLVAENGTVYCTLSLDEMSIRRNVQWSDRRKKFVGGITYGSIPNNAEYLPVANNAIVFMVNGINIKFNLPIQFEFINSLQSHEKAAMILMALKVLNEIGIKVMAITFDGLANNISTCNLLGACFNVDGDFRPHIINPYTKEKVYIILDPPHMIKLIRNCIGTKKSLYHADGLQIEWKFFEALVELETKCDIVTHKLTKDHILFDKNIMNVRLATQTLSESTARSMELLASDSQTQYLFEGSKDTAAFARRMNNLFDIFNSNEKCPNNLFKSPINNDSKQFIFSFLDETVEYIKKLSLDRDGDSILKSKRKTGFKGFIINAHNLKEIYSKYVESEKIEEFLATRLFNQDPLENFFGRIRSCLGSNDNPTTEQFCGSYRKVLVNAELTCSALSNCVDQLKILHVSSDRQVKSSAQPAVVRVDPTFFSNRKRKKPDTNITSIETISNLLSTNRFQNVEENDQFPFDGADITITNLANLIEEKIEHKVRSNCDECARIVPRIFIENEKTRRSHSSLSTPSVRWPCQSTVDIGQVCNDLLRLHSYKIDFNYAALLRCIDEGLESMNLFAETDFSHNPEHKNDLIKFIIEEFLRIRATYTARKITLNEKKKMLRRKALKLVHYAGE